MATHSSILAWRIPRTEEPGGLHRWTCKELDMDFHLHSSHAPSLGLAGESIPPDHLGQQNREWGLLGRVERWNYAGKTSNRRLPSCQNQHWNPGEAQSSVLSSPPASKVD